MRDYLPAAALTLLVELPVYGLTLALVGVQPGASIRWAVLANVLTHPLLWWVLHPAGVRLLGAGTALAAVEVWAVAVEAILLLHVLRGRDPLVVWCAALLANASSFLIGFLLLT